MTTPQAPKMCINHPDRTAHYVSPAGHLVCTECSNLADANMMAWGDPRRSTPIAPAEAAPAATEGGAGEDDWGSLYKAVERAWNETHYKNENSDNAAIITRELAAAGYRIVKETP